MKIRGICLLAVCLTSCAPVYQTDYTFLPPENQHGQTCVLQCENTRLQCRQLADARYQTCLSRVELAYQACEARKIYRYDYKNGEAECVHNCYCYRESCTDDSESCQAQYRGCYQTCGGQVLSKTYCVSNCDEVGGVGAPPPGQSLNQ